MHSSYEQIIVIVETGASARNYCELSGRTEPLVADVILALINMGMKLDNIETYSKRQNRTILPALQQQTQAKQLNILQAGVKQSHPSHIPNYLPPFPDPHAYIRTPVNLKELFSLASLITIESKYCIIYRLNATIFENIVDIQATSNRIRSNKGKGSNTEAGY